jgi:hypothetical protein
MMVLSLDDVVSISQSNMVFVLQSWMEFFVFSLRKVRGEEEGDGVILKPFRFRV